MTPEQITLVQSSFESVKPIAQTAAELFYGRLFELNPSLRPLFKTDMSEQQRKLMDTLEILAKGLRVQQVILPALKDLGRRHVGYGVKDEHYEAVGSALLWTLEKGLGEQFTPEVKEAWVAAYGLISGVMKEAAAEATESAAPQRDLQAQMLAQQQQLAAQQQQIEATNQLVRELRDIFTVLQQNSQVASKPQTNISWWRRLWGRPVQT